MWARVGQCGPIWINIRVMIINHNIGDIIIVMNNISNDITSDKLAQLKKFLDRNNITPEQMHKLVNTDMITDNPDTAELTPSIFDELSDIDNYNYSDVNTSEDHINTTDHHQNNNTDTKMQIPIPYSDRPICYSFIEPVDNSLKDNGLKDDNLKDDSLKDDSLKDNNLEDDGLELISDDELMFDNDPIIDSVGCNSRHINNCNNNHINNCNNNHINNCNTNNCNNNLSSKKFYVPYIVDKLIAHQSAKPITHQLSNPTAQQPSNPTVHQSLNHPTYQPTHPTYQPPNQPAQQPLNQPAQQPLNQPAQQPLNQPTNQPLNQPTNQPTNQPPNQPTQQLSKITLNIGGKKFNLKKNILQQLNINYTRLHKIKSDTRQIYFLDRDPIYFSKIMTIIKAFGFGKLDNTHDFSAQLLAELYTYGLLDNRLKPMAIIKTTQSNDRNDNNNPKYDNIVKIVIAYENDNYLFETLSNVLSKSLFFSNRIKLSKTNKFYFDDINPKKFRYVLNFLRFGELYINDDDIIGLLNKFGIQYQFATNTIVADILSCYMPTSTEIANNQLTKFIDALIPEHNFMDNRYYYPTAIMASTGVENINIISTQSKLLFDSDIVFDLTQNLGECIEDLVLCIDIPVIDNTLNSQYVNNIGYYLVESIDIVNVCGVDKNILLHTNGHMLYMYPIIYTNSAHDYHQMASISTTNTKLMYENELIDICRIMLPLFLFNQSHLPIKKFQNNNVSTYLIVKLAPLNKLFTGSVIEIPLLNVSVVATYINLASKMTIIDRPSDMIRPSDMDPNRQSDLTDPKKTQQLTAPKKIQIPINAELKVLPIMYVYSKCHTLNIPIQSTSSELYNIATIPLSKFGLIKDFFFTIIDNNNINNVTIFTNNLIEVEILHMDDNSNKLSTYGKMDSLIMNTYVPLKKLGHKLQQGIYYFTFSSDPKCCQLLGGLVGTGYIVRIKTKKMSGIVRFYLNEYVQHMF